MRMAPAEVGHLQSTTLVATDNTASKIIVKRTEKQKRSGEIDMRLY